MNKTIEQVQSAKRKTEIKIANLIEKFCIDNNVSVEGLMLDCLGRTNGGQVWSYNVNLEVKL